jgi:hypothetical protein
VLLFQSQEIRAELHEMAHWISIGYMVGVGISMIGWVEAVYKAQRDENAV